MKKECKKNFFLFAGILAVVFTCIPFLILGEDSVITYHDQLDGELLTYLFHAKYMFSGMSYYPELMNGIPKAGLASPAPAFILLFRLLEPFEAFLAAMFLVKMAAFVSMYLLIDYLLQDKAIGFLTGILFMLLPFYPVYGFCIPGQPFLWYAALRLKNAEKRPWVSYFLIFAYGACSSFALGGFACLAVLALYSLVHFYDKKNGKFRLWLVGGSVLLFVAYLCANLDLVRQFLPGNDEAQYVSHRSEAVIGAVPVGDCVKQIFLEGADYAQSGQKFFLPVMLTAVIVGGVYAAKRRGSAVFGLTKGLLRLISALAAIGLFYVIYNLPVIAALRNSCSGLFHDFNLGRVAWLMPVLWYLALAYSIKIILLAAGELRHGAKVFRSASAVFILCICLATAWNSFYRSDLKSNVAKLLKGEDYYMLTWRQFYAEDLFGQVDELIGRPKEEYRVVSLGIYPAAAAYNGFYCLDAYSNNYDIEYKHEFRKIIEGELAKSRYLAEWFDDWGNRCYIVLAETNNYFTFEKRWSPVSRDVDLNWKQLRAMGCEYIISASYIMEAEEMGLHLLNEEPIQTEDSWYRLYVYQL